MPSNLSIVFIQGQQLIFSLSWPKQAAVFALLFKASNCYFFVIAAALTDSIYRTMLPCSKKSLNYWIKKKIPHRPIVM